MPRLKNPFSDASNSVSRPCPTIESTRQLAAFLHRNQKEASGAPYINHPVRVAQNLQKIRELLPEDKKHIITENVIMAALLHDVMEDCYIDKAKTRKVNASDLSEWGYNVETIEMIALVTKPAVIKLSYEQKTDALLEAGNPGAICIKLADNMDNSHPIRQSRLARTQPERVARLAANYTPSIQRLSCALGIDPDKVFQQIEENYQTLGKNAEEPII